MGDDYPYTAKDGICRQEKMKLKDLVQYINNNWVLLPEFDNESLVAAIQNQPVSVALNASTIRFYQSGVFNDDCDTEVNHGVLAVGYGEEDGKKFYKIKNSWGADFGEKGYF